MDRWDVAQAKVRKYELQIEELEDDYRDLKKEIEEEENVYYERLSQFRHFTDIKVQEAMADFRLMEIDDYSPFMDTVEMVTLEVENSFSQIFYDLADKRDQLDKVYRKAYREVDEKLNQAYAERRQADYELQEKGKKL